jgi:glycosyltransferase involved in cell wall biosynthesis
VSCREKHRNIAKSIRGCSCRTGKIDDYGKAGGLFDHKLGNEFVDALGQDNFVELGRVSDEVLEDFYANVDVIIVPSLYEGFGLPILEVMVMGVPVISSDSSSLPEVGGHAALYFDPHKLGELADKLVEVCDEKVTSSLKKRG